MTNKKIVMTVLAALSLGTVASASTPDLPTGDLAVVYVDVEACPDGMGLAAAAGDGGFSFVAGENTMLRLPVTDGLAKLMARCHGTTELSASWFELPAGVYELGTGDMQAGHPVFKASIGLEAPNIYMP